MTVAAHLNALHAAAPVILWVEDALTRDYLTKAWGEPAEIAFFLAGGKTAVRPAVEAARREGLVHVFGLVDRDFGTSNLPQWGNPAVTVFRLPSHEIENYLLGAAALAGCGLNNRGRTVQEVEAETGRLVSLQPCWMACRRVLSELQAAISADFPPHPAVAQITSVAEAEAHIRSSSAWFGNLTTNAAHWTGGSTLTNALQAAHADMLIWAGNGSWVVEFSGREIFRPLRSFLYQPPGQPGTSPDNDVALAVGTWQEQNNAVPPDVLALRSALRQRVGLPP